MSNVSKLVSYVDDNEKTTRTIVTSGLNYQIMENAPIIAQAIAEYTGMTTGQLRKASSEGDVTTGIILNSIYNYADEINALFNGLPITVGDSMQDIKDSITKALEPIAGKLSALVQTKKFQDMIEKFIDWVVHMMDKIGIFFDYVITNWDKIVKFLVPALGGLAAAIIGVKLASALMNKELFLMNLKMIAIAGLVAIAIYAWQNWGAAGKVIAIILGIVAAALIVCTIAQKSFNLAALSNPLTWILVAVIGLIALVIVGLYYWRDETIKIFEVVGGYVGLFGVGFHNTIAAIWNAVASFMEFFVDIATGKIGAVIRLFVNFADSVLGIVKICAYAIDAVFGTNLANGIEDFRNAMKQWSKDTAGESRIKIQRMQEKDGAAAIAEGMKKGNEVGNAAADSVKSMVDAAKKLADKTGEGFASNKDDGGFDYDKFIKPIPTLKLGGGSIDTVGKINDDVSITEEDIKLLKDVASAEFVNRYTTLRPEMTVTFGDVRETADVSNILETIEVMVEEAYASALVTV